MVDIRVPFSGFYESMHSNSVDEMVKSHTSWLLKETGAVEVEVECFSDFCDEEPADNFVTAVSDCIDYPFVFEKIAQKYVEHFGDPLRCANAAIAKALRTPPNKN